MEDREIVEAELIVWSTGNSARPIIAGLPFALERGRILTDAYLRVVGHPEVYALGDGATPFGRSFPQTAQVAMQGGKYLGRQLNRIVRARTVAPFTFMTSAHSDA